MPDKLLHSLKLQSTILPSTDPSPSKQSHKQRLSTTNLSNPEQDYNSSNWLIQNDQMFKIINMDNGNGIKDCKAMLDMMKQEFLQQTQKLSLFYQPDLNELLQSVKINDINVKRNVISIAEKEIQSKIKNVKIKKRNQIFTNYSKLMKYSLRENQRINFVKESAKIKQSSYEGSHDIDDTLGEDHHRNAKHSQQQNPQPISILQRMMRQKRNKIAIQNSSKMNQQWKELEGIMKNRAMCEKILEEALMFERYYHIMKKEKQKVLEGDRGKSAMDTGLGKRRIMTQVGLDNKGNGANSTKNQRLSQSFYKRPRASVTTRNQSSAQKPSTSIDPRHLRLPQSSAPKSSSFLTKPNITEQDYYRQKFMASLQRDQYLRQLNRVNDEIVQKKNMRNNCLIGNVLGLIRENTVGVNRLGKSNDNELKSVNNTEKMRNGDKMSTPSRNSSKSRLGNESVNRRSVVDNKKSGFANKQDSNNNNKVLTGSELTRILRRLFLIYSSNNSSNCAKTLKFSQNQQQQSTLITLTTAQQSLTKLSQHSLRQFFSDFNLGTDLAFKNNKIQQILDKDCIDEFQFIQLIHLLSATMHNNSQPITTTDDSDGVIYTNINEWICKRILDGKNAHLLQIKEQTLLSKMRRDLVRLRKYYRLEETLNSKIDEFITTERINKLKIKTLFEGFDDVLEMLWSLRVYPQFVSKNTCRFYFQYLKEDKHLFLLDDPMIRVKRPENVIVENIIWLVVANSVINDPRLANRHAKTERERNENGENVHMLAKDKMMEKVFGQRFKLIINSINNLTSKNNSSIKITHISDNDNDNNSQHSPVNE